MHPDIAYKTLVESIFAYGERKTSRGGDIAPTIDLFGPQIEFDLRDGFPLLTTKHVWFRGVWHELMWMLRGDTNIASLKAPQIWEAWAKENGEFGPIYGKQWREWVGLDAAGNKVVVDQLANLVNRLNTNPDCRRLIISAWNASQIKDMALPPCHSFFQFSVSGNFLDLKMYQRSADTAIGVPFNIAQYALLLTLIAREVKLIPRRFIHTFGSAHIYETHIENLKMQIERTPKASPQLLINEEKDIWQLMADDDPKDYKLVGYEPHPKVEYKVEV